MDPGRGSDESHLAGLHAQMRARGQESEQARGWKPLVWKEDSLWLCVGRRREELS